jgi:hypothetical protein
MKVKKIHIKILSEDERKSSKGLAAMYKVKQALDR